MENIFVPKPVALLGTKKEKRNEGKQNTQESGLKPDGTAFKRNDAGKYKENKQYRKKKKILEAQESEEISLNG